MWVTEKSRRMQTLYLLATGVILLLLARLAWLQLWQGPQYKLTAEENRTRKVVLQAPRGAIYDRNGFVLVSSRPSFAISVLPAEYTSPNETTPLLAELTGISQEEIGKLLEAAHQFPFLPVRIRQDVDATMVAKIEERQGYLPGVIVEAVPVRYYVYQSLAAHVFGYVGAINEEESAAYHDQGYDPATLIGKAGLEKEWETSLRGQTGDREVEVDAQGKELRLSGEKSAIAGNGLVLTLDIQLQKIAEEALQAQILESRGVGTPVKGGGVIVLQAKTGAVLAMASSPTFNPNLFASGISVENWNSIVNDPLDPLMNRSIQDAYPPGSVFKIVTAAAALDSTQTSSTEVFEDKGFYTLQGWKFYGWETTGLGRLTIVDALAVSSDPVFYELGRRLGPDNLANYAATFTFGQKTDIRLSGEEAGLVPTPAWKEAMYGEGWYPGETIIAAIGQGYYTATLLQQARLLMAVANGGIIYRPYLVDRVLDPEGAVLAQYGPEISRTVYLQPEVWGTLRQGLEAVTVRGTAKATFQDFPKKVAGKTGSAETGHETVHAWFACYAPSDNPEIIVAVLVEDGGEGSVSAAPIARKVLEGYFGQISQQ